MLAEWAGLFEEAGWTPRQLDEATDWLAMNAPPRFRQQHLPALQARVRSMLRRASAGQAQEEAESTCFECGGSGRVSVPNPKALARGEWTTQAVACTCALGEWFRQHGGYLGLTHYQFAYPDWRRQMAEHGALLKRELQATATARALDEALGEIRARVRKVPAG